MYLCQIQFYISSTHPLTTQNYYPTFNPWRWASDPNSTLETKNPVPCSRPPRILNPRPGPCLQVRPGGGKIPVLGLTRRTVRTRDWRPPPPLQPTLPLRVSESLDIVRQSIIANHLQINHQCIKIQCKKQIFNLYMNILVWEYCCIDLNGSNAKKFYQNSYINL